MTTRDKKLLIMLAGALLLALSYFFVFQKQNQEKEAYEIENQQLQAQYEDLYEKSLKADEYKQEIEKMNGEIVAALEEFPSLLQIENVIMDVVELENKSKAKINSLTVADATAIDLAAVAEGEQSTNTGTDEAGETDETGEAASTAEQKGEDVAAAQSPAAATSAYQLYNVATDMSFTGNTKSLKSLISLIVGANNKESVKSLTVAYDSNTGLISGTFRYDSYFLYGLDKPYVEPHIPSMSHGLKDMFGTKSGK